MTAPTCNAAQLQAYAVGILNVLEVLGDIDKEKTHDDNHP